MPNKKHISILSCSQFSAGEFAMRVFRSVSVVVAIAVLIPGCASTQLNYNALDLSNTVDELIMAQVRSNLAKFADDSGAIPSQVTLPSGSVTTQSQVSASWTSPVGQALTVAHSTTVPNLSSITTAQGSITPGAVDQWSQNWGLSPVTDGDQVRRLRALYRYVTHPHDIDLCAEYPRIAAQLTGNQIVSRYDVATITADDAQFLTEPGCIICAEQASNAPKLHQAYKRGATSASSQVSKSTKDTKVYCEPTGGQRAMKEAELASGISAAVQKQKEGELELANAADAAIKKNEKAKPADIQERDKAAARALAQKNLSEAITDATKQRLTQSLTPREVGKYYINPRLTNGWLKILPIDAPGSVPTYYTPIATSAKYKLYSTDMNAYHDFVLFTLEATSQGSTSGQSGKGSSSKGGGISNGPGFLYPLSPM
jgi:hypothetical protein